MEEHRPPTWFHTFLFRRSSVDETVRSHLPIGTMDSSWTFPPRLGQTLGGFSVTDLYTQEGSLGVDVFGFPLSDCDQVRDSLT